ncbi:Hsp33 family molecular chaperone HslO [filamentous cyanobacterium LEGE 11480]|uniref:33 kDa chaperonin n=1 Tax=Romeriopsis navalis LEGE 11480 TaxID=2777977 RepID=A0A928VPF0_9CYAN|nr:Hsp33 family molecular chaperone HslO [Romeriopsis navalis]MBE9031332.1 Hsp33 family molecular chaperone HslO [Romeriopsis navalis LEGE 11480]
MADQLVRATAAGGGIRAVGVITTRLTEEARQRHKLSYVATAALGRTMAGGLLLASSMKRPDSRVNLRIKGDGPMGGLLVDAGLDGTVRGYVDRPEVELPLNAEGKLDVGGAIGKEGFLYAVRDTGVGYHYSSTVELVSGEIGEDLTYYLATSEQTPSALLVGVFMDVPQDCVESAGGLLIQVLPKAAQDDSLATLLESRIAGMQSFTAMLRSGKTLQQMMEAVLGDLDLQIFPEIQLVRFHCGCTKDRVLNALPLLGEAELLDMIETDGGAEATCHFCNTVYTAGRDELHAIVAEMRSQPAEGG